MKNKPIKNNINILKNENSLKYLFCTQRAIKLFWLFEDS